MIDDRGAPEIETERLTLRGHTLADFAESAAMWGDPEVTRHIGGKPSTREQAWARLLRCAGHWALLGFGLWVVRERASGRFVGEVGFLDLQRDLDPPLGGAPEIGWVLSRWAHGRGFATEAALGALAWGEQRFGTVRTVCLISPENAASIRVAGKCGYRELRRTAYEGKETIVLER